MQLTVTKLPSTLHGKINKVYLSADISLKSDYVKIKNNVFYCCSESSISNKSIGLNKAQRTTLQLAYNDVITVDFIKKSEILTGHRILIQADTFSEQVFNRADLIKEFKKQYLNYPFNCKQTVYFFVGPTLITCIINEIYISHKSEIKSQHDCILSHETEIFFSSFSSNLLLLGQQDGLLRKDFNFEDLGIGGLKKEFSIMFRRAFVQRIYSPETIKGLGVPHVKGILLYGPPGTGKTLVARQIGTLLNARPPKIVNGPEVLNKYVGQSEENIRNLFLDAEEEYKRKKEHSSLHIIIFDELDAIFKVRGHTNSCDQIVNQLLSKMDGVERLDNILVIGMTNRPDLIDKALLRPGRFEIHIEISLPDYNARLEIFRIHTKLMKDKLRNMSYEELAKVTKNYTGAEIQAVVKSAVSFALERNVKAKRKEIEVESEDIVIDMNDFLTALDEVKPAYGVKEEEFYEFQRGEFYALRRFVELDSVIRKLYNKLLLTKAFSTSSFLLFGPTGCGKTKLAVNIALAVECPFVKIIMPKHLIGMSEYDKINYIKSNFLDAYRSEQSIIILDDLEGLIEYVEIGPRFSNNILQALKVFIKSEEKNKVFVFGTCTDVGVIRETGLFDCFDNSGEVGYLTEEDFGFLKRMNEAFDRVDYVEGMSIKRCIGLAEITDLDVNS